MGTHRSTRRRSRLVAWALIAVAVVAVGAYGGYRVYRHVHARDVLASQCALDRRTERQGASRRREAASGGGPLMSVLGDSYAQGLHLTDSLDAFPYPLAQHLHYRVAVTAEGGTGYVEAGPCGGEQFATRADAASSGSPTVILVEGGTNDEAASPATVTGAAIALFRRLHSHAPTAQIVALSPFVSPARPDPELTAKAIARACQRTGVRFLSVQALRFDVGPDRLHPTVRGDRQIAGFLSSRLRPAR